jgi:uncharacterized membrane protein
MEPSIDANLTHPGEKLAAKTVDKSKEEVAVAVGQRVLPIDALRGVAMIAMALDHAASFLRVGLQAETYGGLRAVLESWPHWLAGLFTNVAAPTFWLLSGVSVVLLETSRKKKGETDWKISQFLLIRAGLILILDMTICEIFWAGKGPYTHVLLSIGLSLMLLSLLRLLPVYVTTIVSLTMLIGYQVALPYIAEQFSQTTNLLQALLFSYSTVTFPAVEFSIFGWAGLMFLGYSLGKGLSIPALGQKKSLMWAIIALFASWLVLRMIGGFGDLTSYTSNQPWYYFLVMSKTPPSMTYLTFNLGLAGIIFALFSLRSEWLKQLPMKWLVLVGQVSLFFFVMHIVVFGLISRVTLALDLPIPGMVLVFIVWVVGLVVMLPITSAYRTLRKRHSILRYL